MEGVGLNLAKYTAYFHDGGIIAITNSGDSVEISMDSAEISQEENIDNVPLSIHRRLKGKLHLQGVEYVKENDAFIKCLEQKHDKGNVMDFEIADHKVFLQVMWENYPFREHTDLITYEIKAKNIYWENIPDLFDPWW